KNDKTHHRPEKITAIESQEESRLTTSMKEFNRVLGGGIVPGSLVLIGGDPGIGKSTLLLQISAQLAEKMLPVLYISGEESPRQTKLRADRLVVSADLLFVLSETNLFDITQHIEIRKPTIVIVDSMQTIYREEVSRAPWSVCQVRESTGAFTRIAKTYHIHVVIDGQVT